MFELLVLLVFIWLLVKAVGLTFKLTWGMAKIIASILMVTALPLLLVCMLFFGGLMLLIPLVMIAIVIGLVKACN